MRILENVQLTVSEDNVSNPVEIRFQTSYNTPDTTSVTEIATISQIFPIATTPIDLGNIVTGKFISIKPTIATQLDIDGEVINFKAGKRSILWVDFTALSIIQAVATNQISIIIGGV